MERIGKYEVLRLLGAGSDDVANRLSGWVTDASFKCDVELEVTAPGAAQRSKAPANFTFTKGSEGWTTNLR